MALAAPLMLKSSIILAEALSGSEGQAWTAGGTFSGYGWIQGESLQV